MMLEEVIDIRKQRSAVYGPPMKQMGTFAALVNAKYGTSFTASDMCVIEMLHKISRIGPIYKRDHYADIAGYADCGAEINEKK
jgi:hypothetical protein